MDKEKQAKILKDLIQINSVNGNEIDVAAYLAKLFEQYGFKTEIDAFGDRRANLIVEFGSDSSKRVLGVTGHMDTVAIGNRNNWHHDPFGAETQGDRLYGRGAADMKSGLAAQVIALIELKESGWQPDGKIRFIATAGEEYGTPGANRLEERGIAKDLDALIVGEPTGGNIVYATSGSYNYQVICKGRSAHSSMPERGVNAVSGLARFIELEDRLFDNVPLDQYLGSVKHSITILKAGDQVNTIPDHAELRGNIRPTRAFDNQKVTQRLNQAIDYLNQTTDYQLSLNILNDWWPIATDPQNELVKLALTASKNSYQKDPELTIINGATDASVFVKHRPELPVIVLGADEWSRAHQVDEYTTWSSYFATIGAYQTIMRDFFA
ncbi:ArgE/DapE family deacylase [Limosilactobacillus mucosae]|uniref:Probable succinyl-diaminopimelate desuccinylase n=1 Tax=Limosilactobacillus mucosae TaxID=97478 RepID=A0AAJ1HT11_LIMMU|nr:ArgE/DapE family deacylase [Limosilactobacillus mucosae]MDC2829443.1 ArgE/DapE family deacylase [Limosilactobacillus mucosae]MDC2837126.1 ArgE/DapE family deacylase [Limosilactobacillus mucosae]MDC2849341.1 ArgE/DapE family deacylase [Limosilactobacillus mucosae]MDC2853038.1 ArgE/DapE family deacylase [Limosilactobacillus mucosae]